MLRTLSANSIDEERRVRRERFRSRYLSLHFASGLAWKIVRFVLLFGLCYIILYPFLIKIINAFKGVADFSDPTVRFIPKNFTVENVLRVFGVMDYWQSLLNTFIISLVCAVLQTGISALVGYGFARFKFRLNKLLFGAVIFSLVVPVEVIIIPLFLRFRHFLGFINLIDTPLPIFILSLTGFGIRNALYIFLLRQFFRNMPKELEEAAYLDGCGVFRTYWRVMLPSAGSMLITVFLLSFAWQWTDTVYSSLFLREFHVLANMVSMAESLGAGEAMIASNYIGIAACLAVLPLTAIYIVTQRFFVQSVATSGLVG
ncbi:MAG: carbohydrate ABC transporter permease [Clostridia bacterium]|nr:carbohydrate ABC transporter permease [Clostridia bacterium]